VAPMALARVAEWTTRPVAECASVVLCGVTGLRCAAPSCAKPKTCTGCPLPAVPVDLRKAAVVLHWSPHAAPFFVGPPQYVLHGWSLAGRVYSLAAVICHLTARAGTGAGGHYVCYARNTAGRWRKFNDAVVTPLAVRHVMTKNAYILMYVASDQ